MRAAGALTLSLVVAREGGFDHGFWVVLGTLLVLRSSAADTEVSARQSLVGTLGGFLVAAPLIVVVGGSTGVLWALLPLVTFAAAWAPGAIGMGTGQGSFTVFVVVLFNIISPEGYTTAVARLEDVAIGAAVAVVAGFLFWPRGSESVLAPAVARHYRAARDALGVLAAERLGTPLSPATKLHSTEALLATRAGLNETFADLAADLRVNVQLAERTAVFTPPSLVDLAVTTFGRIGDDPREERAASDDRVLLESRAFEVETGFDAIADTLHARSELRWQPARAPDDPTVVVPPDRDPRRVLELLWLGVWLDTIERALGAAAGPTIQASTTMPRRWWR